ncbi:hypothetical protein CIPAW_05G066200 [Carya illinoinensis]|nr:hypothetical protein CIPAW_05G066200 [Carya illinoinensis]
MWAIIDTAAASHSSSKSRKPLAIKYPKFFLFLFSGFSKIGLTRGLEAE